MAGTNGRAKRAVDAAGAIGSLILLSPLLAVIALLVKLTSAGPLFYKQTRIGLNGRQFEIIKFRTMHVGAERDLGPVWSVPNDPRCTRLGSWLRRFGLDELPQLWNILRGEMSLVGPRPERPHFVREFRNEWAGYDDRHSVRCGLTGYAQIHGWRGDTSVEERLKHDLYYVRNWSWGLDARILFLTLLRGWSERTRNGVGPLDYVSAIAPAARPRRRSS